jgi:hypothetical protein
MLERLFNSLLLLAMAAVAWLAAWVGRRDSTGLAVLLGFLGVLALGVAIFALVWIPS